jgi:hypothetical protein
MKKNNSQDKVEYKGLVHKYTWLVLRMKPTIIIWVLKINYHWNISHKHNLDIL